MVVFCTLTHADPPVYSGKSGDEKTGTLSYTVVNLGEPAIMPYRLTVSLRCAGKSADAKLSPGENLKNEAICQFREPEFNKETKVLTIHYSTSEFAPGVAKCNTDWAQDFDLKALCP